MSAMVVFGSRRPGGKCQVTQHVRLRGRLTGNYCRVAVIFLLHFTLLTARPRVRSVEARIDAVSETEMARSQLRLATAALLS